MMTFKDNVSAVLNTVFTGFKDENIQLASDRIAELYTAELGQIICELRDCYTSMPVFNRREWQEENKAYLDCESIIFDHMEKLKGRN